MDQVENSKISNHDFPASILVIEDDLAIASMLENILQSNIEGATIKIAADGDAAWKEAGDFQYDLILADWKLPGPNGLALLNRFRMHNYYSNVPVLICSGYLKQQDYAFIEELPLTDFISKPFNPFLMMRKIKDLQNEALWHLKMRDKIDAIFTIDSIDKKNLIPTIEALLKKAPKPLGVGVACIRTLRQRGYYKEAYKLAKKLHMKSSESLAILNELGKIYLHSGRVKEAKETLAYAYERSPQNLERICDLGAAKLQSLEVEEAAECFRKALEIDDQVEQAKDGIKLTSNMESYFKFNNPLTIPESFAGLLNAIGIAMVRTKNYRSGVEHYNSALRYVYNDDHKSKLSFNLGLGFLRWKKYEQAHKWLAKALEYHPHYEKPLRYLKTVEERLESLGLEFKIVRDEAKEYGHQEPQDMFAPMKSQEIERDNHDHYADANYKELMGTMIKRFPEMEKFFRLQMESGIHIESQVPEMMHLMDEYSDSLCKMAIEDCIKFKKLQATDFSHYLKGYKLLN